MTISLKTVSITLPLVALVWVLDVNAQEKECFHRAELTLKYIENNEVQITKKLFRVTSDMFLRYVGGKLKYPPLLDNTSIVYGGTCNQTQTWTDKLSKDFKVTNIEEKVYDILFLEAHGWQVVE